MRLVYIGRCDLILVCLVPSVLSLKQKSREEDTRIGSPVSQLPDLITTTHTNTFIFKLIATERNVLMTHNHTLPLHLIRKVLACLFLIDVIKRPISYCLCFHSLHCGLRLCTFSYHSALFICKLRGVCQSAESCVITHFTPAAILGLSNKTSTSVVSCWCGSASLYVSSLSGSVRGERLWSPIELVGVAFWFFQASGEKQNTDEGFKERSCNF